LNITCKIEELATRDKGAVVFVMCDEGGGGGSGGGGDDDGARSFCMSK